jgi:putative glutamine amidotransferase
MTIPLIGITTSHSTTETGLLQVGIPDAYVRAVARAGAYPVLIPLSLEDKALSGLLSRLDGILFSGGGDVHPRRYGEEFDPLVNTVDEDRDRVEIDLIQDSIVTGKPFLGICRGLQVINVALGGSLYADIRASRPEALKHDCFPEHSRDYLAHTVQVDGSSSLARVLGQPNTEVNSMHHQGIHRLASGLVATAFAPDGIVEAIELPEHPFGLAVQWHPEWLQEHASMRRLFQAFVQAAIERDTLNVQR